MTLKTALLYLTELSVQDFSMTQAAVEVNRIDKIEVIFRVALVKYRAMVVFFFSLGSF